MFYVMWILLFSAYFVSAQLSSIHPLQSWHTASKSEHRGITGHIPTVLKNGEAIEYKTGTKTKDSRSHIISTRLLAGKDSYWVLDSLVDVKFVGLNHLAYDHSNLLRNLKKEDRCPQLDEDSLDKITSLYMYHARVPSSTNPEWIKPDEFASLDKAKQFGYCVALDKKSMVRNFIFYLTHFDTYINNVSFYLFFLQFLLALNTKSTALQSSFDISRLFHGILTSEELLYVPSLFFPTKQSLSFSSATTSTSSRKVSTTITPQDKSNSDLRALLKSLSESESLSLLE